MRDHLSDEQWTEALIGGHAAAEEHLAACSACRVEQEYLGRALEVYREAALAGAERPEVFWQGQRRAILEKWTVSRAPRRVAWAAAAVAVVLAAVLLLRTAPPLQRSAEADLDHALLVDVERSVRRELPRSLEPAELLAQEVSRDAEAHSNP